jgi:hypothetical protein
MTPLLRRNDLTLAPIGGSRRTLSCIEMPSTQILLIRYRCNDRFGAEQNASRPRKSLLWPPLIRLHEKGGTKHSVPCHHALAEALRACIDAASIADAQN